MAKTPDAGDPTRTARALLARVPVVTWVGIGVMGVLAIPFVATGGFPGLLVFLGLAVLVTAIYVVATRRRSWLRLPTRTVGVLVLVGGVVLTSIGAVTLPRQPVSPSAAGSSVSERPEPGATRHPTPTPSATFSDESPADPDAVTTPAMSGAAAVDRSVTSNTTALALLAKLPVKGAPR
ncbi:hypothetical protein GCM10025881_29870 [Pseudolysinimonas kribbensis]|uniref:Uncharacterized protein n=1 Tax=Pseudolysinimonas kribbensis TaxID=433641 RepID=A0ABQ6K6A6_9MICO|nr:hypothetical protein [Pseudolysinimonas kribbensis]GMA96163.1 hypothetical protein GCM10025881_29870 [Pseudolysinimonas kribbensis]